MGKENKSLNNIWKLTENKFILENNRHFEGAMCIGSGYMSVRASLEEGLEDDFQGTDFVRLPANVTLEASRPAKSKWGTYVPGVMGKHPIFEEEIMNLPWFAELKIWFENEKLDMENSDITSYKRELNMKTGELTRSIVWKTKNGSILNVHFNRFICMDKKQLSVQNATVEIVEGSGAVDVQAGIDAHVRTNGHNHFKNITYMNNDGICGMQINTDNGNEVTELSRVKSAQIKDWTVIQQDAYIGLKGSKEAGKGEIIEITKYVTVATDRDINKASAKSMITEAYNEDYTSLLNKSGAVWESKWNDCDIEIEGDDDAQLAIRFSMYHLIRANAENDGRVAICAKGHAGDAYWGRFFWDTEIFLMPFFLMTNIKAAKNLLMFRYNTLKGAKQNAKNYGYNGARYAWESSTSGTEQCKNFQYGDHEVHITADVSYGIWNYYCHTGDKEFLLNEGLEIMLETAKYWTERVDYNSQKDEYNLIGVMGPDEYLAMTRNNAFTNNMVKLNLNKAVQVANMLKTENKTAYEKILEKTDVNENDLKLFTKIADSLPIFKDEQKDLVLECEEFYEYADLDFDSIWKDRSKAFGLFISQEKNYRSKALKQADVLEMMRLFPDDFTDAQVKTAYEYYEPITTHDSSLSAATHGITALRLGMTDDAVRFLKKTLWIDLSLEKKGAEDGIHIANCGGIWQLIVYGFAGLKTADGKVTVNPKLPPSWKSLTINVVYNGKKEKFKINN